MPDRPPDYSLQTGESDAEFEAKLAKMQEITSAAAASDKQS